MEIHHADRAYRARTLLLFACTTVLCATLLWQLNLWLGKVSSELVGSDPETVRRWLRALLAALGVALALPAAALGLNLRKLAFTSRLEGRFPPRAWKTLRDVRVLRDAPALLWARRIELAGSAALLLALVLLAWAALAWWRFG
jgi:hypothetical protein